MNYLFLTAKYITGGGGVKNLQKLINRGVQIMYEGGANKARRRREGVNFLFQKLIYNIYHEPASKLLKLLKNALNISELFLKHSNKSAIANYVP